MSLGKAGELLGDLGKISSKCYPWIILYSNQLDIPYVVSNNMLYILCLNTYYIDINCNYIVKIEIIFKLYFKCKKGISHI